MQNGYDELLESSLNHLRCLKAKGDRFVLLEQETWTGLCDNLPSRNRTPLATSIMPKPLRPTGDSAKPSAPPTSRLIPISSPAANDVPQPEMIPAVFPMTSRVKSEAMLALRSRALGCSQCAHLAASRQQVVFGTGNIDSSIMFIGEAPGAEEDQAGEPFVGKAGQLLTRIIETMGLTRSMVYIANILKCRPNTPEQASGNRKPTSEEMDACVPFLHEQIDIIRPKVLIALGTTAVEGLLGGPVFITKLRGQWQTYRNTPLMPTYHPSYVLRKQTLEIKRQIWEDMLQAMAKAGLPISEKQRGFFLNP